MHRAKAHTCVRVSGGVAWPLDEGCEPSAPVVATAAAAVPAGKPTALSGKLTANGRSDALSALEHRVTHVEGRFRAMGVLGAGNICYTCKLCLVSLMQRTDDPDDNHAVAAKSPQGCSNSCRLKRMDGVSQLRTWRHEEALEHGLQCTHTGDPDPPVLVRLQLLQAMETAVCGTMCASTQP
jgi:hypothetical protein